MDDRCRRSGDNRAGVPRDRPVAAAERLIPTRDDVYGDRISRPRDGIGGFPLGVVEAHQYAFETASLYAAVYLYLFLAGPGRFSAMK